MRLSRAVLVMLLLHVIAVGGILAFSLIKQHGPDRRADGSSPLDAEDSNLSAKTGADNAHKSPANNAAHTSVHVVRPGETLVRIANDNGVTIDALVAANGAKTAMSSLRPGQELKVPDKSPDPSSVLPGGTSDAVDQIEGGSSAKAPAASATPSPSKPGNLPVDSGKTYVVGKGESPYTIAQKLKVTQEALLKLNGINDPKKLKPGQRLRVPAAATAPKPKAH